MEADYKAICDSLEIFDKWAKRGRILGQIKDKYDTTRWYAYLCTPLNLHTIFYPQHYYNRFPLFLRKLDRYIFEPLFRYTGASYLFGKWQIFCYRKAYKEVLTKYPHVRHCIDHRDLLG